MCLIFFSIQKHPTYKLVVAANRDEFYNRKTAAAAFWADHPEILGGRDLQAQGTWMAMTKSGKISMLTNYRDPQNIDPKAPSRGQLVSDYLVESISPQQYLHDIDTNGKKYNGFNLIVGDADELFYYSNYKAGVDQIEPGIHGLSNHLLDTPWPKVEAGKKIFSDLLKNNTVSPEALFKLLYNEERASDERLPNTGLTLERERALSSMFIKTENYGSRCSTVVLVDHHNNVFFSERVFNLQTFEFTAQTFEFTITPAVLQKK